jgi:hypothetical protein
MSVSGMRRFILWWNWVFFSRKQISENQRNLFYQCSYRQRKWNTEEADLADLRGFILWWNWVFFSRKQISENQRNLFYQCSYRQRKWNTEEADLADLHGFASGKP